MNSNPESRRGAIIVRLLVLLLPVVAGLGALWLGQDTNWDLRNYHYYVPFAYLHGRIGHDIGVAHIATYYNPALYLPFYWAVNALTPRTVGFLLGFVAGLNGWLLYLIARQIRAPGGAATPRWVAGALGLAGLLGAMNLAELGTSSGDNILSLPVLGALWLILRFRDTLASGRVAGWGVAAAAGLLCGIAFGLKLPFAVYAVAGCMALFALQLPVVRRLAAASGFGVGVLAGVALAGGYWFLEMNQRFGNPLFPYFNALFQSPWAAAASYRHAIFIPADWSEWLRFPFYFATDPLQVAEVPFRDLRFPLLYVLLVASAVRALWNRIVERAESAPVRAAQAAVGVTAFLAVFCAVAFVLWMALFAVSRYTVTIEMLAPTLAWGVIASLLPADRLRAAAALVVALVMVASVQPGDWGRRAWAADYFGVVPPATLPAGDTLVLMAGYEPSAYLIPFLPPRWRFLRIQGYLTGPSAIPNGLDRAMREAVSSHDGPLLLMYREYERLLAVDAARAYGLAVEAHECEAVLPAVEPDRKHPFLVCVLHRLEPARSLP